jgi:hypothetical protein
MRGNKPAVIPFAVDFVMNFAGFVHAGAQTVTGRPKSMGFHSPGIGGLPISVCSGNSCIISLCSHWAENHREFSAILGTGKAK